MGIPKSRDVLESRSFFMLRYLSQLNYKLNECPSIGGHFSGGLILFLCILCRFCEFRNYYLYYQVISNKFCIGCILTLKFKGQCRSIKAHQHKIVCLQYKDVPGFQYVHKSGINAILSVFLLLK